MSFRNNSKLTVGLEQIQHGEETKHQLRLRDNIR